jgi:anthranilate phosphoribosyltransferase
VRKALGVRTIFNFLGPLTNPAGATRQLIGVSDASYLELMAGALARLGCTSALVVSSEDGMDEVSVTAETRAVEVTPSGLNHFMIAPEQVGLERASAADLEGGDPACNADIARAVLGGEPGPRRALVAINAGAALMVAGQAGSLEEGVRQAEQAIDSGAAKEALERFVGLSVELGDA